ncbi:MAG TPA: putative Ig domain-containing protein [Mycobacteriales bacterium]|nr:putative Ig domain-containing protein [Mycobacteriales bacterium]
MTRLTSRLAAAVVVTALIGGALALTAAPAGATPTSGVVTAWGANTFGQAGLPAAAQSDVTAISAGFNFGLALKTNGSVVAWGDNSEGATSVPAAAGSGVVAIDAEQIQAIALKADGSVVSWGHTSNTPANVAGATQIAAFGVGGLALMPDHTIRTWGYNSPAIPAALQGHTVGIDAGNSFVVALTDTGSVVAFAAGPSIAAGTVPDAAKSGVRKVVAGGDSAAALKDDGSVVAWGANFDPTPAAATSGVVDLTVSDGLVVALKSDGTLVPWTSVGYYYYTDVRTIPPAAGYKVSDLASGMSFAMTLHQPEAAPTVTTQPAATTVTSGRTASLSAAADGFPTPTAKWQRASAGSDSFTDIPGATTTSYTTGTLTTADSGVRYRAVFTNSLGTTTSQAAAMTVSAAAPTVTTQPAAATVTSGSTASLTAAATGDPTPTVKWQRAASGSDSFTDIPGATGSSYTTGTLTTADGGARYRAVFSNAGGTATSNPAAVTVNAAAPTVTRQPDNTYRVAGDSAVFTAAGAGDPAPTVKWQRANPGSDEFTDIPGATASTYTTGALSNADGYSRYRAVFTNSAGSVTSSPATLFLEVATPAPPMVEAPNAAVNQPYLFTIPVTGVLDPTVTKTSGTLPPGLSLSANGTLSGTPTTAGNWQFAVTTNGSPSTANVRIAVQPGPTIAGTAPDGQVSYQYQWIPTLTGRPTLTVSAGALPDGVRISNNQLLTGVPTRSGAFTFTLQADNGYGTPATLTRTVTIKQGPGISLPLSGELPRGTVGTPYAFQFNTTGYPAPTVTIASGTLPTGLSIDATGKITGTPTKAALFGFTVKASNGAVQDSSTYATIAVNEPSPAATITGAPPAAVRNADYSYIFTLGGNPTPTVTRTSGTLPPGLTLTGATLAGQPTQNGTYTFTLTASNQYGTADLPVTMIVGTAPVIGADAPTGTVGAAYAFTYPVTASPDASVTVTGTPPAGLDVSSGIVSGTPTKAGVYTYTVTATNQFGTASRTQQVTVDPATAGQAKVSTPPASVQPGAWESDDTIRVFGEKTNQVLSADLTVGGVTIPAGTKVNSYYVHADAVGNANTDHPFSGSVSFGTKVLGVATSTAGLQATAPAFGVPGTTYSTSADQGLEYNDTATLSTQSTVSMSFHGYNTADAIRIITLAP